MFRKMIRWSDLRGSWRLEMVVASSATSEPLSEVHSRFISVPHAASPGSVSSSRPVYQSASCEVRPSYYIPLDRLRGVYTIQASSGIHIYIARRRRDAKEEFSLYLSRSHSPFLSPVNLSLRSLLFSRLYLFVEVKENKTEERRKSACCIVEPRGVGARIKGAVRLGGAPNYDVMDRTRRDQVSRIQNGLLITGLSYSSNRHGGHHLPQPISARLYAS